MRKYD